MTRRQARSYLGKAEEYLAAAEDELDAGRPIAATSLAIHAAINAADAVCGMRLGQRAAGQDHNEVFGLLATAGAAALDEGRWADAKNGFGPGGASRWSGGTDRADQLPRLR